MKRRSFLASLAALLPAAKAIKAAEEPIPSLKSGAAISLEMSKAEWYRTHAGQLQAHMDLLNDYDFTVVPQRPEDAEMASLAQKILNHQLENIRGPFIVDIENQ